MTSDSRPENGPHDLDGYDFFFRIVFVHVCEICPPFKKIDPPFKYVFLVNKNKSFRCSRSEAYQFKSLFDIDTSWLKQPMDVLGDFLNRFVGKHIQEKPNVILLSEKIRNVST